MLCPLDALQIDAFLNHLPQRTDGQGQKDSEKPASPTGTYRWEEADLISLSLDTWWIHFSAV